MVLLFFPVRIKRPRAVSKTALQAFAGGGYAYLSGGAMTELACEHFRSMPPQRRDT